MWGSGFHMGNWGLFGGMGMFIGGLFFLGLIVLVVVLLARGSGSGSRGYLPPTRSESSRPAHVDILKERYARGEITREEFEQMRKDLES